MLTSVLPRTAMSESIDHVINKPLRSIIEYAKRRGGVLPNRMYSFTKTNIILSSFPQPFTKHCKNDFILSNHRERVRGQLLLSLLF